MSLDPSPPALRAVALAKSYARRRTARQWLTPWRPPDQTHALGGVDLEVRAGELVTILGPNGAGKTTLLKILATLIAPSAGQVIMEGEDVTAHPARARARIGYVQPDERSFFWRLTCRANLRFFAELEGFTGGAIGERIREVAALVGLSDQLDRDFMDLSTGQRQRMAIARGLLPDPPLLLFDEATRSLDPGRAARLRRVIRDVLVDRAGKAVLFATHDLEEARALSDRVVLMAKGRVAAEGRFAQVEPELVRAFGEEADAEDAEFRRQFPELVS